jgi:hypothetical protein
MSTSSRPTYGDAAEWVLNTIKRNPEGLLLLAAGAVLMMRTNSSPSDASESIAMAYDRSSRSPTPANAAETVKDAARQTINAAQSYASSASEYAGKARRAVGEQSERIVQQTQSIAQGVVQNQPLAIALVGLAAGAALAATFPATDLEKQTLGPMGDQMSKAAERVGDQLKQATAKAGEKLKSVAEERGLHTQGLKDVASEVVDTFKDTMKGNPEGVRAADILPTERYRSDDRSK